MNESKTINIPIDATPDPCLFRFGTIYCCGPMSTTAASSSSTAPPPTTTTTFATPIVTRGPLFIAGRKAVGEEGAVEIFATLLESTETTFGEGSIETAPGYYEYGNALLRRRQRLMMMMENEPDDNDIAVDHHHAGNHPNHLREAAALAAEARRKQQPPEQTAALTIRGDDDDAAAAAAEDAAATTDGKEAGGETGDDDAKKLPAQTTTAEAESSNNSNNNIIAVLGGGGGNGDEDLMLALEMMETAFSIMDEYIEERQPPNSGGDNVVPAVAVPKYYEWVQVQMPRVLTGLGDVLLELKRIADGTDAYLRALVYRNEQAEAVLGTRDSVDKLAKRLKVVEANVLIVEALLTAPLDQDLVTSETNHVLVKAGGIVEYAQGYYDKARMELQETLLLMGQLAAWGMNIDTEKEEAKHVATLVMAAGMALAGLDEQQQQQQQQQQRGEQQQQRQHPTSHDSSQGPRKKKAKQSPN
jgi:hypothetical protein